MKHSITINTSRSKTGLKHTFYPDKEFLTWLAPSGRVWWRELQVGQAVLVCFARDPKDEWDSNRVQRGREKKIGFNVRNPIVRKRKKTLVDVRYGGDGIARVVVQT